MTRRLTLAILLTTIAALLVAGLATLVLARAAARRDAEAELRRTAVALAAGVDQLLANGPRPTLTATLRSALRVDGIELLTIGPAGRVTGTPPAGVSIGDLSVPALQAGQAQSGRKGDLVYAAAPATTTRGTVVAVLTRRVQGFGVATGWFLLAALMAVALSAVVAVTLGRRLTRPIRQIDDATRRIAAGELSTRLPDPPATAHDELTDLARSVNVMATNLQRSQGLEQQFLLSVSHDLRTPLTSIRGYAEAIHDGVAADPAQAAGVILSESRRLERLVADLLDLARLQSRSFSLQLQPVDLAAVMSATVAGFQPDAAAASRRLIADDRGAAWVQGDPDRLAQVVANLVENALRHAATTVVVGTSATATTATLWVDDDGHGIAPADRPHVFERLYVAPHEPSRRESGSGLGLAIVRELVHAMGGEVAAEEAPAGGARLVVRLPASAAKRGAPTTESG
jgi:two-component system sensor histidine kinase BaeS